MPNRMPENISNRISDKIPEDMSDRIPDKMPEDISNRMLEDLPISKYINIIVGITGNKIILN